MLTCDDVDPERIGVTEFSGGGTITSYIAAFDDRVKVSVPCSWSTASRRQLETKGVQDAETIFVRGVAEGITFEDLIGCIAPRKVVLADLQNQRLEPASGELIERDTAFPRSVYTSKNAPGNLKITSSSESAVSLVDWSFK